MGAISDWSTASSLASRFRTARERTLALAKTLTPEDMMIQSCPEASPAKWHLAHTAWFFESFILREFLPGYRLFNEQFPWLFNSYYQSFSAIPEKRLRASFSRPGLDEVLGYREHVDRGMDKLLERLQDAEIDGALATDVMERTELGVNHEEQHQELLLTDILHAFYTNPLRPAFRSAPLPQSANATELSGETKRKTVAGAAAADQRQFALTFAEFAGGLGEAGHKGSGFCFDNELPRHRVWLDPYHLSTRLVTCAEYAAFMADGGYLKPELWLSAGWDAVKANGWKGPSWRGPKASLMQRLEETGRSSRCAARCGSQT